MEKIKEMGAGNMVGEYDDSLIEYDNSLSYQENNRRKTNNRVVTWRARKRKSKFNPDSEYIQKAMSEFKKGGGVISRLVKNQDKAWVIER